MEAKEGALALDAGRIFQPGVVQGEKLYLKQFVKDLSEF